MPRNNRDFQTRKPSNRTGLRNKGRKGNRSSYGTRATRGDYYGKWENGKQLTPDRIAGRVLVIK